MKNAKVRLLIKQPLLDKYGVFYMNRYYDLSINIPSDVVAENIGDTKLHYQVIGASVDINMKYLILHLSASIYLKSEKGFVGMQTLYRIYPYPASNLPEELRIEKFTSELEVYGSVIEEL
ncbi:MAG: hypothetical protein RBR14_06460 [Candidatus Cloacimonas acidaminovorans]|nr:hypothetical protein [Candidatus Cloacimonas acidaminovorans]